MLNPMMQLPKTNFSHLKNPTFSEGNQPPKNQDFAMSCARALNAGGIAHCAVCFAHWDDSPQFTGGSYFSETLNHLSPPLTPLNGRLQITSAVVTAPYPAIAIPSTFTRLLPSCSASSVRSPTACGPRRAALRSLNHNCQHKHLVSTFSSSYPCLFQPRLSSRKRLSIAALISNYSAKMA